MNPLALLMSKQMQPQAPDYAMPGPAPDMATANAMAMAPHAMQQMPAAQRPSTDMEIVDFINELKPHANQLPPQLKLKLDKLLVTIGGGAPQGEGEWDMWEEQQDAKKAFPWE
jgi:hypothetical protein